MAIRIKISLLMTVLSAALAGSAMGAGITIAPGAVVTMAGSPTLTSNGDWDNNGTFTAGSGAVILNGTASTTLESGGSSFNNLTVNKTAAGDANDNVTVQTDALTVSGTLTITDGELIQGTTNLTLATLSIAAAGRYSNASTGDLAISGSVANAGTIIFNSSDDAGNGIAITSTASPTQRNWQGAGVFSFTDITAGDQTCLGGSPASITANSSTNGGNNINWLFGGGALAGVSVAPASLVAGSTSNNTVTFTTASAIASNGKIRVTFPAGFDVSGVTTATSASDLDGVLTVGVAGQVVTITRSGGTNFSAAGTVDDLIIQGVVNPVALGLTGTFTVETLDSSNNVIDTGTGAGVTIVVGTASATTFIDASANSTATYTLASANSGKIYLNEADSDENANAAAAETVSVVLTSAATGDSETVTLTETGVNTGIFRNTATGLAYDVDDSPVAANGILETRPGDTITAAYTDNDDGADTSSDTAQIADVSAMMRVQLTAAPLKIRVGEMVTFTATMQNLTSETLSDFKLVCELPSGVAFKPGSVTTDSGSFTTALQSTSVTINGFSAIAPGASRKVTFSAVAGSRVTPGSYPATLYARFNPVISNASMVTLVISPDPVFHIGTLIGKVFHDRNGDGVQDEDEPGIPNAVVATEQGYVITTDSEGRYHVPDFLSGRHMIKLDRASLPGENAMTTPQAVLVNQTDAMLTKVNFGVQLDDESAGALEAGKDRDIDLMVRGDAGKPVKRFGLEFHEIVPDPSTGELSETAGSLYRTDAFTGETALPFRVAINYPYAVTRWSVELSRYENGPELWSYTAADAGRRITEHISRFDGTMERRNFGCLWDLPFEEDGKKLRYQMLLTIEDAEGNRDTALYDIEAAGNGQHAEWKLTMIRKEDAIPVTGTPVKIEGRTHARRIIALYGDELLSGDDGAFHYDTVLPAGRHEIRAELYLYDGEAPVRLSRRLDLRDTAFFWVGFGEMEWGTLDIKGSMQSVTAEDKARFQDSWYDESRVAYYLKGKIKGKYLITASVDTDREKRELFRHLEPDDYYAVYGDGSKVTADASDTQDKYYLLLEVDRSFLKYGNFNTGFTGTEYADFNRSLHGAIAHYETLAQGPDAKPVTYASAFIAKARQTASRNEFLATGGSLYYLKHKEVVMGSEKVKAVVRDKDTGVPLKEIPLAPGSDYEIDYDQGRIRLTRPVSIFSFGSDTILSSSLLPGHPHFVVVDYEYLDDRFVRDTTSGARASHSFFSDVVRLGGTWVSEERSLERYELHGTDVTLFLPLETVVTGEYADSTLEAAGEFISENGGLTFTDLRPVSFGSAERSGQAWKTDLRSKPWDGGELNAYFRTVDPLFSSNGSAGESGTEKMGFSLRQETEAWGNLLYRFENERVIANPNALTLLSTPYDRRMHLVQYSRVFGRWETLLELRQDETGLDDQTRAGIEARYALDERTRLTLTGQKSIGGVQNDQVRAGIERDITKELSVRLVQSAGTRGTGTLFGLDSIANGLPFSFYRGMGSLHSETSPVGPSTQAGFSRKFGEGSELSVDQGIGSSSRTVRYSRKTPDGRVMEYSRQTGGDTESSTYSETRDVNGRLNEYSQTSMIENKRTGEKGSVQTRGTKAKIWGDRASIFQENSESAFGQAVRKLSRSGLGLKIGSFGKMDMSYEHDENRTAADDPSRQTGRIAYDYYEFSKLRFTNMWEARLEDKSSNDLQLLSSGRVEIALDPDWTALARYEWSGTRDRSHRDHLARFSEVQTGLAYRPVRHDRLNWLGEYKYLNDASPLSQSDTDALSLSGRHVARMELAFDIHPRLTLVEKLAFRSTRLEPLTGEDSDSQTLLAAQRVNFHVTPWMDLSGEYRYLTQSAADDVTQGVLAEMSFRLNETLWLSLGYDWTDFESQLAHDLNVETQGFYVRLNVDALEAIEQFRTRGRTTA